MGARDPSGPELDAVALAARLGLVEELSDGGGPRLALTSELRGAVETIGSLRRFVSRGSERAVDSLAVSGSAPGVTPELLELRLAVPLLGLAMERVFGFAASTSAAPHLLFGVATTGASGAVGVSTITADLLPRLDLMVHPGYAEAIYLPLPALLEDFSRRAPDTCDEVTMALEGPLGRRLLASPWASRLVFVAGPPALRSGLFGIYAERWLELLSAEEGSLAPESGPWDPEPVHRDRRVRAALSEGRGDPLWRELARLCGPDQAAAVRDLVRGGPRPSA